MAKRRRVRRRALEDLRTFAVIRGERGVVHVASDAQKQCKQYLIFIRQKNIRQKNKTFDCSNSSFLAPIFLSYIFLSDKNWILLTEKRRKRLYLMSLLLRKY